MQTNQNSIRPEVEEEEEEKAGRGRIWRRVEYMEKGKVMEQGRRWRRARKWWVSKTDNWLSSIFLWAWDAIQEAAQSKMKHIL